MLLFSTIGGSQPPAKTVINLKFWANVTQELDNYITDDADADALTTEQYDYMKQHADT